MITAMKLFLTCLFFTVMSKVGGETLEESDLREYSGLKFAPVSGLVLKKNTDGKIIEKNHYVSGTKNGASKFFHINGNLRALGEFADNVKEGSWSWFRPDGSLERKGRYIRGKWDGSWEWYDEQGDLSMRKLYKDGIEQ